MPDEKEIFRKKINIHLQKIYKKSMDDTCSRILECIGQYEDTISIQSDNYWSEKDVVLITYGDSLVEKDKAPLNTLQSFLHQHLAGIINCVHILPFFPYSSDDGFSVIDYKVVNPDLGEWEQITRIASEFRLMADLVINHVSRESLWFYDFVADREPASKYFICLPPETDVSQVTRPRNTPLLVPVQTHRGILHLWATFSEDQIDLNFANPEVLLEFINILLFYISKGVQILRLDAVAFLWKELGTNCVHLDETHEVVKLFRTIFDYIVPGHLLLTETNVPHHENISYFGDADEAHMVYQFTLPPLLLHALNRGTSKYLTEWAAGLPQTKETCTYFNFTASHDGIGLRALEGILPGHEIEGLIESMHKFGGFVSMKANPDGKDTPYEINISLFDAMQGTRRGNDQWQLDRFICSQAIMLSMKGIPALYIHSLLATPNDMHGVEMTGRTRSINRKKWDYEELQALLSSENTPNHEVFKALRKIINIRTRQACFHPDCDQEIIDINPNLFSLLRTNQSTGQRLLAVYNVTIAPQLITITSRPELSDYTGWYDLMTEKPLDNILPGIMLQPYQVMWLVDKGEG